MFDRRLLSNFDWLLCGVVLLISAIGILALHSATYNSPDLIQFRNKQITWVLIGCLVAFLTTLVHYRTIAKWGYFFHFSVIVLLILVLLFGTGGPGSPVRRWLALGPIFIQPSEFAKFTLVLVLAYHYRDGRRIGNIGILQMIWPLLLAGVPLILIVRQPDLGTGLLLLIIFVPMLFLAGMKMKTMLFILFMLLVSLPIAWFYVLKPYQKDRILTFINPERDPLGTGYHVIQSKIAIGSGGLSGKGFLEGTQGQLNFLPAHHTDFIFSVFAEEWGFIGAIVVLLLFLSLILLSLTNIIKVKDRTSAILTVGIVSIITSQVLINIGMVIGLMPVVGVPLPFFSYGGSSLLSLMFGIGLLMNIRMRRFEI